MKQTKIEKLFAKASREQLKHCMQAFAGESQANLLMFAERANVRQGLRQTWLANCLLQAGVCTGNRELAFRDEAWRRYGGIREVQTPVGRIDLLLTLPSGIMQITSCQALLEAKYADEWKSALGQALAYGHYYPKYKLGLALIGDIRRETKLICESHDVSVLALAEDGELKLI